MKDSGRRHAAGASGNVKPRRSTRFLAKAEREHAVTEELAPDAAASGETASPARGDGRSSTIDPRRKAMELLTRREHSRQELERKLVARGFDDEAVRQAVEDMAARGWQDDTRFAHALARTRLASGHGPIRIRAELRQHDIASDVIEAALDACEVDWNALAADVLHRRFGPCKPETRQEMVRRGAFLQRRGFDLDAVRHALAQADRL